jgi:hypothetical protein
VVVRGGQLEPECGALGAVAVSQSAVEALDDSPADVEAQAGALRLGGDERLEDID